MRKLIPLSIISACTLAACNANGTSVSSGSPPVLCSPDAPLFTSDIGVQTINAWGANAVAYGPSGSATCISNGVTYPCTDTNIGAAFFTGSEYVSNGVLLPTVSAVTRVGSQTIYDYFTHFLVKSPVMTLESTSYVTLAGCGYGVVSGYYDFAFSDGSTTNARYTFQFQYQPIPQPISITVESGTYKGTVLNITESAGWRIMLQNSAVLPVSAYSPETSW